MKLTPVATVWLRDAEDRVVGVSTYSRDQLLEVIEQCALVVEKGQIWHGNFAAEIRKLKETLL